MNSKINLNILVALLILIIMTPAVSAEMIEVNSNWEASVFGNVGGDNKITAENFAIQELDKDRIKMMSANNRGKIESSSEGIAYYFKKLKQDDNFEMSVQAEVQSFDLNNQVSFGIMVRDKVLYNKNNKKDIGYALAVGPLNVTKETPTTAFYRTAKGQKKLGELVKGTIPAPELNYKVKMKKFGDTYWLKFGEEEPVIVDNFSGFEGEDLFAGLYTSRNTTVIYSDLKLEKIKEVEELNINSDNFKKDYLLEEDLNLKGLDVTAEFADGSSKELSSKDYIVTGFNSSKAGKNTIKIQYGGAVKKIDLNISELTATALKIKYYPAKTNYYLGDQFESEGLLVIAEYNNGYREKEINSEQYKIAVDGTELTDTGFIFESPGEKNVSIIYKEKPEVKSSFTINVSDAELKNLKIKEKPEKTLYFPGEELDLDGISVYANYDDGNSIRLMREDYEVEGFDSSAIGEQKVMLKYKDQKTALNLRLKEKEVSGLKLIEYPQTTIDLGEEFKTEGIKIAKVYDNGDQEILAADEYTIDDSNIDNQKEGTYTVQVIPESDQLEAITFDITVRKAKEYSWNAINFGQSASDDDTFINVKEDSVEVASINGGGKVATDHDGIAYYYTVLDADDNFKLSADIKVIEYAKEPHDGQEAFGIMARDAIGKDGDDGVFASNIVGVGGYSGGSKDPNGTQLFYRTGVESPDGKGSNGDKGMMIEQVKPTPDNTYPVKEYRLTLEKTNSGYVGRLNGEKEEILFEPELLEVQNDKIYLGFFGARVGHIEVSNIDLRVSNAATDAPKVVPPAEPVDPDFDFLSLEKTAVKDYPLIFEANVDGTAEVKQGREIIENELDINAGKEIEIATQLKNNTANDFTIIFLPDDTQNLTDYNQIIKNFSVKMKTYRDGADIYAAPEGSPAAEGSEDSPLDIDTAVAYSRPGQKIVVLDGQYLREEKLEIKKYNDGTQKNYRYLVAAEGANPVFDFNKKSEGIILSADYWHIKGIDVTQSAANEKGMVIGGNYNIVEESRFYDNGNTGLQISRTDITESDKDQWPSHNLILNSTAFDNADPSNNNADGFAAKLTSGEGNVFKGCISHNNIDDGWDLYTKVGTGAIGKVVIEDSIAYNNGTLTDGTVGNGDKNGFKLGGEGVHVPHLIKDCIAFGNGAVGFASNSNPGVRAVNNVSFNNQGGNIVFTTYNGIEEDYVIEEFISFATKEIDADSYPEVEASNHNFFYNGENSKNISGVKITKDNFESLEIKLPIERNKDGSIKLGDYLEFTSPMFK
ncbi:bacterial Ig-like domain-containing protein [Halanaerobium kushneri]|uniref:Ig-like domain (Group 3) n=1 Tax=Halanaerobium kushneri TaxID=56779 RepID=A0A1N6R5W2_9FIRM|nr:bacterial Ig-like domain-containing protein [Halanaerobium kushneri]SIQ24016.1 Ig-like domain (group 3) [Halanaerobium kushneri]